MQREAYSLSEVMKITGLSRRPVLRAIEMGELQAIRTGPKRILIPRWSLDQFLRKP